MKVTIRIELDDEQRLALAAHLGVVGKASRQLCETLLHGLVSADVEQIVSEYEAATRNG